MFFTNPVGYTPSIHVLFNKVVYGVPQLIHCVVVSVYWVPVLIHAVHSNFFQEIYMAVCFVIYQEEAPVLDHVLCVLDPDLDSFGASTYIMRIVIRVECIDPV